MRPIDMSADAVTARLKLASELRRLCLKLAAAKIKPRNNANSGTAGKVPEPGK
jgi:hypothetical protein